MSNKTTEALKLAEEALQHYRIKWAGEDTTPAHTRKALAAIREALAEPVKQEPVAFEEWWKETGQETLYALNTLTDADAKILAKIAWESAQEKPVKQEPVAYVTGYYGGRCVVEPLNRASVLPNNLALYAAPVQPTKQEPVAYLCAGCIDNFPTGRYETCEATDYGAFPVYAAPVHPVKQEPVEWFHKVGCRANAFGECDMGCQPPVDAKSIRADLMKQVMDTCEAEYKRYDEMVEQDDAGHEECCALIHLMRKLDKLRPATGKAEREWVDLTCEEVTAQIREGAADGGWQGFATRVQTAFKEKNK